MIQQPAQKGSQRIRIMLVASIFLLVVLSVIASQPELWNGHEVTTEDQGDMVLVVVDGQEYFVQKVSEVFSAEPLLGMLFEKKNTTPEEVHRRTADMTSEELAALQALAAADEVGKAKPQLAEMIGGKNRSDDQFAKEFLSKKKEYSDLKYTQLPSKEVIVKPLRVRNRDDSVVGIQSEKLQYAVDLIACDINTDVCSFRINGVSTGRLHEGEVFQIDEEHSLTLRKITFDTCGQKQFCDTAYGSYDEAEVEVK